MALGADGRRVLRMVMREVALLALAGGAAGLALVLALGPLIRSQLYGLVPYDPAAIIAASLLLSTVVLAAAARPAWSAANVNPVVALRHQ